jgi:Ca-activated chloride channel family protein
VNTSKKKYRNNLIGKIDGHTCRAFRLFFLICLLPSSIIIAQVKKIPTTRILFVLDCSLSMSKRWEASTNMDISKKILLRTVDSLSRLDHVQVALRMYGHQSSLNPSRNCKDTRLEVPFSKGNLSLFRQKIKEAAPKGTTPIAYTLEQSGADFPVCEDCRNIIILITDGLEECDGDPCAVSAALNSKGISLRPFVIGVGLDEGFKKTFDCVGKFFDATNEKSFSNAMGVIISQALNSTTMQVNLLDTYGKPTESNVNMSFYDARTGLLRYNYVHALNHKGNPDTLQVDPSSNYDLVIHTLPPAEKKNIELTPGKHTVVGVDVPQGYMVLKSNNTDYKNLKYIIRKQGEKETFWLMETDQTEKFITGKYDLEIFTLPRTYIKDVEVAQSKTTTIQIPGPGIANVFTNTSGTGQLFLLEKNKLVLVYNFQENFSRETLVLQPGSYVAIFKPKSAKESIYTITREFKIDSGVSLQVKLY